MGWFGGNSEQPKAKAKTAAKPKAKAASKAPASERQVLNIKTANGDRMRVTISPVKSRAKKATGNPGTNNSNRKRNKEA